MVGGSGAGACSFLLSNLLVTIRNVLRVLQRLLDMQRHAQTLPEFAGDKERWRWGRETTVTYIGMASGRGVNQAQNKAP